MEERTAAMFSGKSCNGRVLIMDDEPDVRKVVRLHLEKAGYEVMEAEDGEKAIDEILRGVVLAHFLKNRRLKTQIYD